MGMEGVEIVSLYFEATFTFRRARRKDLINSKNVH